MLNDTHSTSHQVIPLLHTPRFLTNKKGSYGNICKTAIECHDKSAWHINRIMRMCFLCKSTCEIVNIFFDPFLLLLLLLPNKRQQSYTKNLLKCVTMMCVFTTHHKNYSLTKGFALETNTTKLN